MMVDFLRRKINNRLRTITISIIHHVFQVNWRIYGAALVFLYKEDLLFFGKQSHPCVSKWTTYLLIIASILGSQLKSLYIWFSSFSCAHVGFFLNFWDLWGGVPINHYLHERLFPAIWEVCVWIFPLFSYSNSVPKRPGTAVDFTWQLLNLLLFKNYLVAPMSIC